MRVASELVIKISVRTTGGFRKWISLVLFMLGGSLRSENRDADIWGAAGMGLLADDLRDRLWHCQGTDSLLSIGVADHCVPLQWGGKCSLWHSS